MSTYKGANKTIIDSPTPSTILDPGDNGGNVRVMLDTFTVATADGLPTTTDVIEMGGELPIGARIIDIIVFNGCGTRALKVGDYESTGRYNASVATTATEHIDMTGVGVGYEVDMTTATTPDNQIILTPIGGALTDAEVIKVAIMYTVE